MGGNQRIILSVEDDNAVYRLLEIVFHELDLDFRLYRVTDGGKALEFLRRNHPFSDAPRPHLVLLDLNLPCLKGEEVLTQMGLDPELQQIPTVMFSASNLDSDKAKCLALGAKTFITKPASFDGMLHAIRHACSYAAGN